MNEETLSSFWRQRRSEDRPIALRDLQQELTYLARLILNDQTVQVAWHASLVESEVNRRGYAVATNTILLDSSPLSGVALHEAIPDERVDALVGDTIYRANL